MLPRPPASMQSNRPSPIVLGALVLAVGAATWASCSPPESYHAGQGRLATGMAGTGASGSTAGANGSGVAGMSGVAGDSGGAGTSGVAGDPGTGLAGTGAAGTG